MKRNLLTSFTAAIALLLVTAGSAKTTQAASFDTGFQATLASENATGAIGEGGPYHVSVNPNNPGYAGLAPRIPNSNSTTGGVPFQRAFTEEVRGFSFVGGGTNGVLTVAQNSGGLISYTTTDVTNPVSNTFDSFGGNQRRLWTTNDPGANLLTATGQNFTGPGYRSFGDITATIDISGLGTGTANIFYGAFNGTPTVSAFMRDLDGVAADLLIADAHLSGDRANRAEYYVAELDFETDGIYDQIVYTWVANGTDNTGNGRFGGTVLTGSDFVATVPEPATATLAMLGLGGLAMRRRRSLVS